MSSSDQDSFKKEDLDQVHAKDPRLVKLEKRKIQIDEEEEDDGYRDSDSMVSSSSYLTKFRLGGR